ncbi:hypothetical protein RSAG8_11312, partial [Rhizoctonia solani AG-8 WAC10335]
MAYIRSACSSVHTILNNHASTYSSIYKHALGRRTVLAMANRHRPSYDNGHQV